MVSTWGKKPWFLSKFPSFQFPQPSRSLLQAIIEAFFKFKQVPTQISNQTQIRVRKKGHQNSLPCLTHTNIKLSSLKSPETRIFKQILEGIFCLQFYKCAMNKFEFAQWSASYQMKLFTHCQSNEAKSFKSKFLKTSFDMKHSNWKF